MKDKDKKGISLDKTVKEGLDRACNYHENNPRSADCRYGVCDMTVESTSGNTLFVEIYCTVKTLERNLSKEKH